MGSWIGLLLALAAGPTDLPVLWGEAAGVRSDSRQAQWLPEVPAPDASGRIVLDGARPTAQSEDYEAPDGLTPNLLRFDFLAPAPAEYRLWLSVEPTADKNQLVEILDGRRYTGPARVESTAEDRSARWIERSTVKLTAGRHRLVLGAEGYTMPRVLAVLLQPPTAPAPEGAAPPPQMAATGPVELVSLPLGPGAEVDQPGADVDAEGRVHLTLDADRPEVGPLTARVPGDDRAVLQHDGLELHLQRDTGDFLLLYDRANDRVIAGDLTPIPLLALQFKRPGEAVWLEVDPRGQQPLRPKEQNSLGAWHLEPAGDHVPVETRPDVALEPAGATIRHRFVVAGVGTATAMQTITARPGGWNLTVTVRVEEGPADVVAIQYPRLPAVRIGGSGWDDVERRMMSFGDRAIVPGHSPLQDATYCGRVVMNWTQVYDREASLYLGAHDPAGTTTVHQSRPAAPGGSACALSLRRCDAIAAGQEAVWPTVVQVGPGGWQAGARTYGDWFTEVYGAPDYPDWLRTSPGWIDLQAENYGSFEFADLPDWLTRAKAIGFDWVQVWGQFGYDGGPCCSAWYGPSPQYGGVAGWTAAATEIRRRGGHVGGYFIYDRVDQLPAQFANFLGRYTPADYPTDLPWDTPAQQYELFAVTDPAGTLPPLAPSDEDRATWQARIAEHHQARQAGEKTSSVQWWRGVWIDEARWRDYLAGWVADRYVGQWAANTAYVDVLGTGTAAIDYDPRRGHNGAGSWGLGRQRLAAELVRRGRQHDPAFGLSQEGLGDLPGLYAAALCSGVYRGGRNIVRYAFPDRVLLNGMANAGGSGTGTAWSRFLTTYSDAMRWDIVGSPTALPVSLLNLSRPLFPELYQAVFRDIEGLQVSDPAITVRRLDATATPLGAAVVTVINPDGRAGTLTADASPAAHRFEVTLSGSIRAVPAGDALVVSPEAASYWLVAEPGRQGTPVWPLLTHDRLGHALRLDLLNLSDAPAEGVAALTCLGYPDPYEERLDEAAAALLREAQQPYRIAPGAVATLRFPVPEGEPAWSTRFRITLPDLVREALLTPLALDPGFELATVLVGPGEGGGQALQLDPSDSGYRHRLVDLWLLPNRRYQVAVSSRRTGYEAAVRDVLIRLNHGESSAYLDQRLNSDPARPNEWQRLSGEITTPPDLTRASAYLYNVKSPDTAWFDNLTVTDLGPAD